MEMNGNGTNIYLNAPVSALPLFELEQISPSDEHPQVPWYSWKNIFRHCDSPVWYSGTVANVCAQKVSPRVPFENSGNVYILSKYIIPIRVFSHLKYGRRL
jgi:hypothetical protein